MRKFFMMTVLCASLSLQAAELDTLKSVELQEVEVMATRATKKTPMAFTNMNKEQLKAVNFGQDIPYLLSLTPSVTMTSDAGNGIGYTSLRIRGTDPSRINITANGVPLNDAESAQLYINQWCRCLWCYPEHADGEHRYGAFRWSGPERWFLL